MMFRRTLLSRCSSTTAQQRQQVVPRRLRLLWVTMIVVGIQQLATNYQVFGFQLGGSRANIIRSYNNDNNSKSYKLRISNTKGNHRSRIPLFPQPKLSNSMSDERRHDKSIGGVSSLHQSTNTNDGNDDSTSKPVDWDAITKYGLAVGIQMTLLYIGMTGLDQLNNIVMIPKLNINLVDSTILNCVLFYGLSLKSRMLNPLSNSRPNPKTLEVTATASDTATTGSKERILPSWTPPGVVFPIVWLLLIGPLRAYTASMIVQSTGMYACLPILAFLFHLSIGDVWNTINNVEKRYGVAVIGVLAVWLSKANTVYQYYQVNADAGTYLSASLVWLTIASALVTATWKLNPNPQTGQPEPLYPTVNDDGTTKTQFVWFRK